MSLSALDQEIQSKHSLQHVFLPKQQPKTEPDKEMLSALGESKLKYDLVKAFEKALKKPWFMASKIKERDCPIYSRWCSVHEEKNVDCFLQSYIAKMKADDPAINPFDMLDEISIVYPTVQSVDMIQLINGRNSFKADDIQWTGHSEHYNRLWAEFEIKPYLCLIAIQAFIKSFDDNVGLVLMLNDINDKYMEIFIGDNKGDNAEDHLMTRDKERTKLFISEVDSIRTAVYDKWFKRIDASVTSIGSFRSIQKSLNCMLTYLHALGVYLYEPISPKQVVKKKLAATTSLAEEETQRHWLVPKRTIPDPRSVIVVRNRRDNSYTCWNFTANRQVYMAFDKYSTPLDTKLLQVLKLEYMYAELLKKQNGVMLSRGYVVVEEKDDKKKDEGEGCSVDKELLRMQQKERDEQEEELWKSQLQGYNDDVKYYETGPGGKPARIVMQGIMRPQRLPFSLFGNRSAACGGKAGGKDPVSDLVTSLKKQISSEEKNMSDVSRMLREITKEEDKNIKRASGKLKDLLSSKHHFVSRLNKNMDTLSKEIDKIVDDLESGHARQEDAFGVIPIRKLVSTISDSCTSVQDIVSRLEASMSAVGINPKAETESDMFRDMDARVEVASNTAIQRAQIEMRTVLTAVENMLDRMERVVNNHTSTLNVPADAHERMGADDVAFDLDYFNDDFAGILRGANEVAPADVLVGTSATGGSNKDSLTRSDELYAEYYSKMKEANSMFRELKGNYASLVKKFHDVQKDTMKKVSDNAKYKMQSIDSRKLAALYNTILKSQIKLNQTGMAKIESVLGNLEDKITKLTAVNQKKQDENKRVMESTQNHLNNILALVDAEGSEVLENALVKSDVVLNNIREERTTNLTELSDIYRKNLEALQSVIPQLEQNLEKRRQEQTRIIEEGVGSDGGDGPSSSGSSCNSSNNAEALSRTKTAFAQYGSAMDKYHRLVDEVTEKRELELKKAEQRELDRKFNLDKARLDREAAIKEKKPLAGHEEVWRYYDKQG